MEETACNAAGSAHQRPPQGQPPQGSVNQTPIQGQVLPGSANQMPTQGQAPLGSGDQIPTQGLPPLGYALPQQQPSPQAYPQQQPLPQAYSQPQLSTQIPLQQQPYVASADQGQLPVLMCRGLSKTYKHTPALMGLDVDIPQGCIVGLLGTNGAGKTTLIKLIAGLIKPTTGTVMVMGNPVGEKSKSLVSYLPERPYFPQSLKVNETLDYFADFYADFDRALAEDMLARLQVPQNAVMKTLSKGTKEKVQLILVMARNAALYLLDEPIAGVDPATRDYILNTIISNYRQGSTILLSTHLISDVERYLDYFVFIQDGRLVTFSTPDQLLQTTGLTVDQYFRGSFRW